MENYLDMTMDQLMERQKTIYKKYIAAANAGTNQEVLNQILEHMEAVRNAMWEQGYKQSFYAQERVDGDPFKDSIV